MAAEKLDWVLVQSYGNDAIGAVGFIGNKAVCVTAFHDDWDANKDGTVKGAEFFLSKMPFLSLEGKNIVEVARQGQYQQDILKRDAGFSNMATKLYLNFARGLVLDGIYTVYFSRAVKMQARGAAKMIGGGTVKEFVIRKGYEKAVKEVFNAATAR